MSIEITRITEGVGNDLVAEALMRDNPALAGQLFTLLIDGIPFQVEDTLVDRIHRNAATILRKHINSDPLIMAQYEIWYQSHPDNMM